MSQVRTRFLVAAVLLATWSGGVWATPAPGGVLRGCQIRQLTHTVTDSYFAYFDRFAVDYSGSTVAFATTHDLTGLNVDNSFEVYLVDAESGVITQISPEGGLAAGASITGDGMLVAFHSTSNPFGTNADGSAEVFYYSVGDATTEQITASGGQSDSPAISDDGTYVAFRSNADHAGENGDGSYEIFVLDTSVNEFEQLSDATAGESQMPSISGSGRFVSFHSTADLLGSNADGNDEAFLVDRDSSLLLQISDTTIGGVYGPLVSGDGSFVVFMSLEDVVPPDDGTFGVFSFDTVTQQLSQLFAGYSPYPAPDDDGSMIVFFSTVNLDDLNPDGSLELFGLHEAHSTPSQSTTTALSASNWIGPAISGDGEVAVFASDADLAGENPDLNYELYWVKLCLSSDDLESGTFARWLVPEDPCPCFSATGLDGMNWGCDGHLEPAVPSCPSYNSNEALLYRDCGVEELDDISVGVSFETGPEYYCSADDREGSNAPVFQEQIGWSAAYSCAQLIRQKASGLPIACSP